MKFDKRINPKSPHHKEKTFFNFVSVWDDECPLNYCDNHIMIYVSHIIMLHTLNLHKVVCQSYLTKTGRKKKEKKKVWLHLNERAWVSGCGQWCLHLHQSNSASQSAPILLRRPDILAVTKSYDDIVLGNG